MLSNYVGEDLFLKGVSIYLKNNLYANTVTHDLWAGISIATGLNITDLMENWITKVCSVSLIHLRLPLNLSEHDLQNRSDSQCSRSLRMKRVSRFARIGS